MKNLFLAGIVLFGATTSFAATVCEKIQNDEAQFEDGRSSVVLTKEVFKSIDVLAGMDYEQCKDAISQSAIVVDGKSYIQFTSHEDSCDGGNTYGSIMSEDLSTSVAHIYDGDVYCEEDWREEERAVNHKCDLSAEKLAEEKMKAFGFDFVAGSSYLTIRKPYIYSYVDVSGVINNKDGKEATVRVLTNIDSCKFGGASIQYLSL